MDVAAIAVVAAAVFVWGVVSARLERADLTAPIVFVVIGAVLGWVGLIDAPSAPESLKPLVEVTLVWVLFPTLLVSASPISARTSADSSGCSASVCP